MSKTSEKTRNALILLLSLILAAALRTQAAAQSDPSVAAFTLVEADSGTPLMNLDPAGASVDLAKLPTRRINIRATTSPALVKKVEFTLNGIRVSTDSSDPYALFPRDGNRYKPWTPGSGFYRIIAVPYDKATGVRGTESVLALTVLDSGSVQPTPSPTPSSTPTPSATPEATPSTTPSATSTPPQAAAGIAGFSLVNADTGATIMELQTPASSIDLSALPSRSLNIRALTTPSLVKKVEFRINGVMVSTDSKDPYALYPRDGNRYKPWTPAPGTYQIAALPYDPTTGRAGTEGSLTLTVTDSSTATPTPTPTPKPSATATPQPTAPPSPSASPTTPPDSGSLPVFPGAAGFGTNTTAGSGRHMLPPATKVFRVTSLEDSGPGTLRECIYAALPRTCVFEVSGIIQLKTELRATSPYLTIAGQTAPAPGILLSGGSLRIAAHDVLVQHLQIRVGDAASGPNPISRDGVAVIAPSSGVYNVVLDHLSVSWAVDENFSTGYPNVNDVTISNSIIAEALHASIHPEGPHSMGMLIGDGARRISIHHNLLAHNNDRNPRMKPGTEVEFISNLVYGWGGTTGWNVANLSDTSNTGDPVMLNFIGNHYKKSPAGPFAPSIYGNPPAALSRVYVLSNIGPTRPTDEGSEWLISGLPSAYRTLAPAFPLSDVVPSDPQETYESVLTNAGSRPVEANSVDERIRAEVRAGTGGIKDCVSGCTRSAGGYPAMNVNYRALAIPADPTGDADGNGYTNLEDFLHQMLTEVQ